MIETKLYRARSTMEALALWLKIMDRWFDGCITWEVKSGGRYVARQSIKELLDSVWRPKPRFEDRGDGVHDRPL